MCDAMACDRLEVRLVPGMGRGVFATAAITRGDAIGTYHTLAIPADEVRAMAGRLPAFYWFEDRDGSACLALGLISLVNHSRLPNLDRRWARTAAGETVTLIAIRDIAAGDQLFIDYRFEGRPDDPPWA